MRNFLAIIVIIVTLLSSKTFAAGGSSDSWSIGFLGGIVTNKQDDMNTLITRANTRVGGISTPQMNNSWEVGGFIQKRFASSIVALQLRPSYLWNSVTGTGTGGTFSYKVSGIAIMPLIVIHVLESTSVKLYINGGVGWGKMDGEIQEASAQARFSGSNFGFQGGVGVNWCFGSSGKHCLITEGAIRYLSIEKNIADSTSGTFSSSGTNSSLSQAQTSQEVELNGKDFTTTFSGVQALVGYRFAF